jgi:hypothetical protein
MPNHRPSFLTHSVCALLSLTAFVCHGAEKSPGFVPLFNGKNLDGWHRVNCAPETFSVRDNMIICTGKPTGVLRSDKQYENFIFEVEWRHMKPKGNAGIFVWSEGISAPGVPFAKSIEVQVLENAYGTAEWFTTHGDIFPIHGSTMIPDNPRKGSRSFPTEERSNPAPQWNKYVIVCADGAVKLSVNGKFVNGGSECDYRKGYLCLESEGSECHFRNLRLYELPDSGADETNTAPLVEGFVSLYSGVDFRGWQTDDKSRDVWKSSDWRLTCKPKGDERRDLELVRPFKNYSVQIDYKWDAKDADVKQAPLTLGGKPAWEVAALPGAAVEALGEIQPGKFKRLRIDRGANSQTIRLNGKVIAKDLPIERKQNESLALRDTGQATTFSSIYVLEK